MITARQGQMATLLPSGQVLVAGGYAPFADLSSAELYDPVAGAWTTTGDMTTARYLAAMVLLHNGQVLVAGGRAGTSAELYTPDTPGAFASLSSSSLDFGVQQAGTVGTTQTITLTNTGSTTLTVSGLSLMGYSADDFVESDDCSVAPIAPNSSCAIGIRFAPSPATFDSYRSAQLSIADNAPGSPQSVFLTGTAAFPVTLVNPIAIDYGDQPVGQSSGPQSMGITNTGTVPLLIQSITLSGDDAGDYAIQADSCLGASLAPQAACVVSITFMPKVASSRSANLIITDNAADSPQIIPLSGHGLYPVASISPSTLDFGDQPLGTTSTSQHIQLTNTGAVNLTIKTVTLIGINPADFSEVDDCRALSPLTSARTCGFTIVFAPSAAGQRSAILSITDNAADSPQSITLTGNAPLPPVSPTQDTSHTIPAAPSPTAAPTNERTPVQASATPTLAPSTTAPTATRTVTATPNRAQQLPLRLGTIVRRVITGRTLTITARTTARARVSVELRVTRTTVVVTGRGKHRKKVKRVRVLYRTATQGMADRKGRFTGRLHITYRVTRPVAAQLMITVHAARVTTGHTLRVTIQPAPHRKR
jgi:hypothetical protein